MFLRLNGKAIVFIDWANVYNWRDELKKDIDPRKLFSYLKTYPQIKEIRFYFGTDNSNTSSGKFLKQMEKIGYTVITKPVKFIKVYNDDKTQVFNKRKCDFDLEIGLDALELTETYNSYIFFTGDGDMKTVYERLIKKNKQVIVIYMYGHLGREIWEMKKGIFKAAIKKFNIDLYQKMTPK